MSGGGIEKVTLWRSISTGKLYHKWGEKLEGPIEFVRADQIVERLDGLAEAMDTQGEHSLDDTQCATYKAAAKQVKILAAELKTLIDNCMKQYATPQPAQLGGSEAAEDLTSEKAIKTVLAAAAQRLERAAQYTVTYDPDTEMVGDWRVDGPGFDPSWFVSEQDAREEVKDRRTAFEAGFAAANPPAPTGGGDGWRIIEAPENRYHFKWLVQWPDGGEAGFAAISDAAAYIEREYHNYVAPEIFPGTNEALEDLSITQTPEGSAE